MQYAFIPRLAACIATLAAPAGAIAQAPSNDNFEAPLIIGSPALPASYAGTTVNATAQVGEPNHANEIGGNIASNSVWYRWSPAATTPVTITALNASFDAALAVYTSPGGLLTDLAKIAASDFFFAADESVSFTASGGTTYYIAVDGFEDSETPMDSGTFTLLLEVASTVENDSFANAITVGNLPAVIASTNVGATIEEGEPTHFTGIDNVNTNSVWFRWVAPATCASPPILSAH
ncbi:MAG: PPC domain-containing protein [Verrucomicrobiales bacterium]